MEKIVTIIIPTYNMESLLDRCLQSLIVTDYQKRSQIEAIVVIDGATDNSSKIAHRYEVAYPEMFCVIDKENGNYGSCVNCALKQATGKYVKVLDADDMFDTEAFESYIDTLLDIDTDLIVTSGVNINLDNEVTYRWSFGYESGTTYPIEALQHVWIHDVTHRLSNLRSIGYKQTEGISYTDEEWVFYPMFMISNFYASDLRLYKYTIGRSGQSMNAQNWTKAMTNEIIVSKKMIEFLNARHGDAGRASNYISSKMRDRMQGFYQRALLTCSLYSNKTLSDFDVWLKEHWLSCWEGLENLSAPSELFRFRYVRYWRKMKYVVNGVLNLFVVYGIYTRMKHLKWNNRKSQF